MFKYKIINDLIIKAAANAALMIVLLFFGSYTCSKKKQLRSIGLFYSYPLSFYKENNETKIYNLRDTLLLSYYSDYILYRLSPTVKFETDEKIKGTEPYFIYNKKKTFGFLFTSLKDSSQGTRFPVDSFLDSRGMRNKSFDVPADSLWALSEVVNDRRNNILEEKYALLKPGDETNIDSIYYYYSKNKNRIDYTFSKKLDSIKGMKLFKIRMLYNEKFSSVNKIILPKRELILEIRDEVASNPKEIIAFIKKFEKCCDN